MNPKPLLALLALAALTSPSLAAGELPYLYQRTGFGTAGLLSVEIESAAGSREAALFGQGGVEQGLRMRYGLSERITTEIWSGLLIDPEGERRSAVALESFVGVLTDPVSLSLGLGFAHDFRDDDVLRFRATASRAASDWEFSLNNLTELPLGSDRDKVDIILGTAIMRGFGERLRAGLELFGQDLEGFWDPNEAEGGARIATGPTLWTRLSDRFELKGNLAAVIQATRNPYYREGVLVQPPDHGFLARVALLVDL
ncbi:MAG: hypothetical protein CME06_14440 [Gemmatimonadetes bacterium]|nr:hypothetical protein [Gemmatimonadota bacterium]